MHGPFAFGGGRVAESHKWFYKTQAWKDTRDAYARSVGGLCEECLRSGVYKAGVIVHHKKPLDAQSVRDPRIALGWDNLELLCRDCHGRAHNAKRYRVDEAGRVQVRGR